MINLFKTNIIIVYLKIYLIVLDKPWFKENLGVNNAWAFEESKCELEQNFFILTELILNFLLNKIEKKSIK